MPNLFSRIYYLYKTLFYEKYGGDFPGATRVQDFLAKIATRKLPKADSSDLISDLEWDNLIILDACRHDLYEEVNGATDFRYSRGSHSREFMENFSEGDWSDTIYISANGHSSPKIFKDLTGKNPKDCFDVFYNTFDTGWDDEKGVVMPEQIVNDAISAEKLFPDKRKIIHFMQPHVPFVGAGEDFHWDDVAKGKISDERAWEIYKENLEFVIPYVEQLCEDLEGKTVVTSDHGNLVGEEGMYDHPEGLNAEILKKVPWDVR